MPDVSGGAWPRGPVTGREPEGYGRWPDRAQGTRSGPGGGTGTQPQADWPRVSLSKPASIEASDTMIRGSNSWGMSQSLSNACWVAIEMASKYEETDMMISFQ